MNIAKVAVDGAVYNFDKAFDYLIPDTLAATALPGCRVTVPFGNGSKKRTGIIMELADTTDAKRLKKIDEVLDKTPLLNGEMLALAVWIKERTFCTLYEAAKAMLPAGINHKLVYSYSANPCDSEEKLLSLSPSEREFYDYIAARSGYISREKVFSALAMTVDTAIPEKLVKAGLLNCNVDAVRKVGDLTVKTVRLADDCPEGIKLTSKQKQIVDVLNDVGTASVREICYFTGLTPAVVTALVNKGVCELMDVEVLRNPVERFSGTPDLTPIVLTDEQKSAYEAFAAECDSGKAGVALLHGVTGSGKTSVYMSVIDKVIADGKNVIVMVPEISLTPQTLALFCRRYGKTVAVFHSALSAGERADEFKRVKRGEAKIVIGTRSAVFAPLENIGLIIIDEEQEHTYKSEQSPRYSTHDVAKFRCAWHKCLLLLSSATPSVESYANAKSGRYLLKELTNRYGNAELPEVLTVDMRFEETVGTSGAVSKCLYDEINANLKNKKQSILLINRRGCHTFAACTACGHVVRCPNCSISMTYHSANGRLMCHYCGHSVPFSSDCPECNKNSVRFSGFGTQKIEEELAELFPQARILRMDADTTSAKYSHERLLESFAKGEYDILVGTQMVAKGLDFPNVTLVGVVSVDQQLNNDDFRSLERTFSLLTQVVGRSGRGESKGKAIIQTLTPENEIIRLAAAQNYAEFFETEIKLRSMLTYPPYCDICVLGFSGTNEATVRSASNFGLELIRKFTADEYKSEKIIVLGPVPSRVAKVNNKYRYRLIIKCRATKRLREMISEILNEFATDRRFNAVTAFADINPESTV